MTASNLSESLKQTLWRCQYPARLLSKRPSQPSSTASDYSARRQDMLQSVIGLMPVCSRPWNQYTGW